jgi:hypothetical protein
MDDPSPEAGFSQVGQRGARLYRKASLRSRFSVICFTVQGCRPARLIPGHAAYLKLELVPSISTKDGGTLRTIREAYDYMAAIGKERELRRHWQQVCKLILDEEADVVAVSWQLRLAV